MTLIHLQLDGGAGDLSRLASLISHNGRNLGDYPVYVRVISRRSAE